MTAAADRQPAGGACAVPASRLLSEALEAVAETAGEAALPAVARRRRPRSRRIARAGSRRHCACLRRRSATMRWKRSRRPFVPCVRHAEHRDASRVSSRRRSGIPGSFPLFFDSFLFCIESLGASEPLRPIPLTSCRMLAGCWPVPLDRSSGLEGWRNASSTVMSSAVTSARALKNPRCSPRRLGGRGTAPGTLTRWFGCHRRDSLTELSGSCANRLSRFGSRQRP